MSFQLWCNWKTLTTTTSTTTTKSLQSCPTLCNPRDGSPPGSTVPGILQATTLEWAAISFSNAWKWKVKVKLLSRVLLLMTPWTAAYQPPPSMYFPGKSTGVGCHCLLREDSQVWHNCLKFHYYIISVTVRGNYKFLLFLIQYPIVFVSRFKDIQRELFL